MRIHTPRISGSLAVSSSVLTIDTLGSVSGSATSTGSFGRIEGGGDLQAGNLFITSSGESVIQVGNNGTTLNKWEWHRDGERKWVIYNDGRTNGLAGQDSLVFKHGISSDGNDHINFYMKPDDQDVYFEGNVTGSSTSTGSFSNVNVSEMSIPSVSIMSSSVATRFDSRETDMTLATASIAAITASVATLKSNVGQELNTDSNVTFGTITSGDINSTGTITATEIHTTFVSSSIAVSSGSNIFGDDITDTHKITGSTRITGSVGINGVPTNPLHTVGSLPYASTATNLSTSTTAAAARIQGSKDASTSIWAGTLANDAQTYLQACNGAGNAADDLVLNPFGGNVGVGIGNATPGGDLAVSSSIKTDVLVGANSSVFSDNGRSNVEINGSGTSTLSMTIGGAAKGLLFHDGTDSYFRNYANGYYAMYTNNTERARISAAGNVLIGTTDDDARLMVKKVDGTSYSQFVTIEGDTTDNNNYPGISFKGGTLANAMPEIGASNGGLMFQLSGGYHSSNYNNRVKIQLNGSDGHILFMTGGDPAVEKAKLDANGLFKINQNNQGSAGTSNKFLSVGGELSTQFDETDVGTMSGMIISNEYTNASNQAGTACGIVFTHHSASSGISYIASEAGANGGDRSDLVFGTRGSGGVEERFRLRDSGEIFIGKGGDGYVYLYEVNDNSNYFLMYTHTDTTFRLNHNGSGSDELQLQSDGDMVILGTLTESSDVRLKENIKTIPDALSKVNQMRGVSYNKIGEEKVRIGMVADEVEKIVPELVITGGERSKFDEDGIDNMKSLKYTNMVGVLVEAVKELSSQVTDLKKEIEDLKG